MSNDRHFTTRRGFVGAMGFGALGLYVTWAAYGASPLPFGSTAEPAAPAHGGHGGHGAAADPAMGEAHGAAGLSADEFERRHAAFLTAFRQPDGSIRPLPGGAVASEPADHADHGAAELALPAMAPMGHADHGAPAAGHEHVGMPGMTGMDHGGAAMATPADHGAMAGMDHGGHGTPAPAADHSAMAGMDHGSMPGMDHGAMPGMSHAEPAASTAPATSEHVGHATAPAAQPAAGHDDGEAPVEVYLAAGRFSFEPDDLRLEVGRRYRFHMMATDVAHGASIAFGRASRIVRLRPQTVTTLDLTFREAGKHLVYCTVYCGPGHDGMHGSITVA